jgi:hypothetical protein
MRFGDALILNGAAMSSSPCDRLWNGDEDVTTPFPTRAVSGRPFHAFV